MCFKNKVLEQASHRPQPGLSQVYLTVTQMHLTKPCIGRMLLNRQQNVHKMLEWNKQLKEMCGVCFWLKLPFPEGTLMGHTPSSGLRDILGEREKCLEVSDLRTHSGTLEWASEAIH